MTCWPRVELAGARSEEWLYFGIELRETACALAPELELSVYLPEQAPPILSVWGVVLLSRDGETDAPPGAPSELLKVLFQI